MALQISSRNKYIIAGGLMIAAFASGRYSVQTPKIETKETQQVNVVADQAKDTHTITTITIIKTPDGTVKTVKDIDTTIATKTKETAVANTTVQQVITPFKRNTLNVSALVGNDFGVGPLKPVYGASLTKEVLGPVTLGAFGFTNGLVGLSIGLNF